MPTASTAQLYPPENWDEFEAICSDLFALEWQYPEVVRYGRKGQRQNGLDIYGRHKGQNAGVQCKGKSVWPPTRLTNSEIDREVTKAKKFRPKLKKFIITTIAEDDVLIQDHVNAISEKHRRQNLFSVHVFGWGELTRRIKSHPTLIDTHFDIYTLPLLRDQVRKLPEATADRVIERLQEVRTPGAILAAVPFLEAPNETGIFQSGLIDALERDFTQRYRRAFHRSFFPEITTDEFYSLAQPILDSNPPAVSAALRRRILLRAARSTAIRNNPELLERLLAAAVLLEGPDSDLPAKARLSEARGQPDEAIRLLRDQDDPDCRSTLLTVIARAKGEAAAPTWLEEHPCVELTSHGVNTLCQIHLRGNDIEAAKHTLANLTDQQFSDCPYFYLLRGAIRFASILPKPEQVMVLGGLPLDVRRARPILLDPELAAALDAATADLQQARPLALELGLSHAPQLIGAYLTWCDLLHPRRREIALAQLRSDMQEPGKALPLIQFALAYDPQFDPASIETYLQRREPFGALNEDELRARLAICLTKDDPKQVCDLIAKYRSRIETSFGRHDIISLEIQALAKSGDATSARLLLEAKKALFPEEMIAACETEIAKAEGADPVAEHLRLYEATKTPNALRALIGALMERKEARGIAQYAEEVYKSTGDPHDIALAAKAYADSGDNSSFVRLIESYPFLRDYDPGLRRHYAWQLFQFGRLKEAAQIVTAIRRQSPSQRDFNLEIAIAIETGEWEQIAQPLTTILERAAELDGPTLIRAAHLSQASG